MVDFQDFESAEVFREIAFGDTEVENEGFDIRGQRYEDAIFLFSPEFTSIGSRDLRDQLRVELQRD